MSTISISELRDDGCVGKAIVCSLEGGIYTLDVETGGMRYQVVDDHRKTLQFHSINEIKESLNGIACGEAVMTQYAAYDEMIGSPPPNNTNGHEMVMPLSNF